MSISRESTEHKCIFGILFFILAYVSPEGSGLRNIGIILGLLYVFEYIVLLIIDCVKDFISYRKKKKALNKVESEWNKLLNALAESRGENVKKND